MIFTHSGLYTPQLNRSHDSEGGCTTWPYQKENGQKEGRARIEPRSSISRLPLRAVRNVTRLKCHTAFVKLAVTTTDEK